MELLGIEAATFRTRFSMYRSRGVASQFFPQLSSAAGLDSMSRY